MNQLNLFTGVDNLTFVEYHQKNPHIYDAFKQYTLKAMDRGYKNWSAKAIFEIIRWEMSLPYDKHDFKINNNYTALYSRMFSNEYPEHKDFFRNRISKFDNF